MNEKSTHRVEVVPVQLEPHPNADSLSVVKIYGYTCVVRTVDWQGVDRGAYIVPDSLVDTSRPEFAFLDEHPRIRVRRFRGVLSQGLLIPAPSGTELGDNVAELLGVTRYEPPESFSTGGETGPAPVGIYPSYDVEDWHRYRHLLQAGEFVAVTEKLHGASSRYVVVDGVFYAGSRKEWKYQESSILWWKVVMENPWIEQWCRAHPGLALYGEVFGAVQSLTLTYGAKHGRAWFRVFDIFECGRPWDWKLLTEELDAVYRVPVLYEGPYDEIAVKVLSRGKSQLADHMREGCVVRPYVERSSLEIGRVQLKVVSDEYLEKEK